ncbi:hypothetical protein HDR61_03200 [bacterium]|nr:hypothetical protein [bacterium]
MARVLQIRRGSSAQNNNFTGMPGEITFDTDTKTLRVHDGVLLGGYPLARADQVTSGDGASGGAFDINSVPDEFWAAKIAQFAAAPITSITHDPVPVRATAYVDYIFDTDKTPFHVGCALVCQTPDAGYSVGDSVRAFGFGSRCAPAPNVFRDASGLHVRMMIGSQTPWVAHHDTGVATNITAGRWSIQFRLYC